MRSLRKKEESKILVKKVSKENSKVKFAVSLEGEFDWNKLFGMDTLKDASLCHMYYEFQHEERGFDQSFINFIFDNISRQDDYRFFSNAKLTKIQLSEEVNKSYNDYLEEIKNRKKINKIDELKKAEKEVARLKSEVLKEFKN
jgi:hypothetical protein